MGRIRGLEAMLMLGMTRAMMMMIWREDDNDDKNDDNVAGDDVSCRLVIDIDDG